MAEGDAATTSWAESLLDQTSSWTLPICLFISCWMYVIPAVNKVLRIGKPSKIVESQPITPSASGGKFVDKLS